MPNLKPGIATASNGNNIGTLVGAAIRPLHWNDKIASAYSFEINGGLHSYETIIQRDSIIEERRDWGMLVNVYKNDIDTTKNKTYQLKYAAANTDIMNNNNWVIFSGGAGGAGGSAYWIDPVECLIVWFSVKNMKIIRNQCCKLSILPGELVWFRKWNVFLTNGIV